MSERKQIVVRHTFETVEEIPADWDADDIDFFYNESSWCANNALTELQKQADANGRCLCHTHTAKFVRNA